MAKADTFTVKTTYRIVDLFAGIGGLSSGIVAAIEEAGYEAEIIFTSEIKPSAIKVLKANHNDLTLHGDIREIKEALVPPHDILLAGFPCQAFSFAGRRQGFEDTIRGTLFFDVARIIKHRRPDYFILENVEGLAHHDPDSFSQTRGHGRTLETILQTLRSYGYQVAWKTLTASDFGVPQKRNRLFILGTKRTKPIIFPEPTNTNIYIKHILERGNKELDPKVKAFAKLFTDHYSMKELNGKFLRDKRGGPKNIHSWQISAKGKCSSEEITLLELMALHSRKRSWAKKKNIPYRDGMPLNLIDVATFYTPPSGSLHHMLERLTKLGYLSSEPHGYRITSGKLSFPISNILNSRGYAPTLLATDAERITVIDGKILRRLTDTEIKRLFGFHDNFNTDGLTKKQMFDLFGNSVVIPVAKEVAKHLLFEGNQNAKNN